MGHSIQIPFLSTRRSAGYWKYEPPDRYFQPAAHRGRPIQRYCGCGGWSRCHRCCWRFRVPRGFRQRRRCGRPCARSSAELEAPGVRHEHPSRHRVASHPRAGRGMHQLGKIVCLWTRINLRSRMPLFLTCRVLAPTKVPSPKDLFPAIASQRNASEGQR
jgi:hypothetical protein